ncbi:MAG: hypothetical protein ACOYO1_07980 [Bacteroidales bacterium]
MNIKEFIENLSEQEYKKLENIVLQKKAEKDYAGMTILEFIEENKYDLSSRVTTALIRAANEVVYVNLLNYKKLLSYNQLGKKSLAEIEQVFRNKHMDTTYFYTVL